MASVGAYEAHHSSSSALPPKAGRRSGSRQVSQVSADEGRLVGGSAGSVASVPLFYDSHRVMYELPVPSA